VDLTSKARLISSSAASTFSSPSTSLSSARVYSKEVARREWERLIEVGLLIPVVGAGDGMGWGKIGGSAAMVRPDVALEEIPGSVKLNATMERWCRQL
jgi:origin recognition complex subunit 4